MGAESLLNTSYNHCHAEVISGREREKINHIQEVWKYNQQLDSQYDGTTACLMMGISLAVHLCVITVIINSLWPSDATWRQRSGSTLAQVMACCLTAPSHYLNQCWLSSVRSSDIYLTAISQEISQPSITKISLKIACLKFHQNCLGAYELIPSRETNLLLGLGGPRIPVLWTDFFSNKLVIINTIYFSPAGLYLSYWQSWTVCIARVMCL